MRLPSEEWHKEIFEQSDLKILDQEYSECEEPILKFAEKVLKDDGIPRQSPENAAYLIGEFAYSNFEQDDYFVDVIQESVDGEEGEKLAKAYIGIQAMQASSSI